MFFSYVSQWQVQVFVFIQGKWSTIAGVEARIEILIQGPLTVEIPQCESCAAELEKAKITDALVAVKWSQIDTIDITSELWIFNEKV